jgi:membrane protease YdiL (CAAX protease family)
LYRDAQMPVLSMSARRLTLRREDGSLRPGWAILLFWLIAGVGMGVEYGLGTLTLGHDYWFRIRFGDPVVTAVLFWRAAGAVAATWLVCRMVRWPMGDAYLRDARWRARALQGVALGTVMLAFVSLVPVAFGHQQLRVSTDAPLEIAATFLWGGLACVWIAISEELWLRGFVLRQLHAARGRWVAAAVTGFIFGVMHIANLGTTGLAIFNVALVGVWLAFTVFRTGSLWLAVGFHFIWDLLQLSFWGEPMSGTASRASVLVHLPSNDVLWTGGDFGPEAGLPNTVMLVAMILLFALWPERRAIEANRAPRMALEDCTEEDRQIIGRCLRATVQGPFFPDWEFPILFGLERAEVARVLLAWPNVDGRDKVVRSAVHSSLGNLLGYPHGEEQAWDQYISVPRARVQEVFERWILP